jgi:predicted transcriptional regulator
VGGVGKAQLRSVANLNHVQSSEYVGFLLEKGLLEDVEAVECGEFVPALRTTEKGMEFVENLRFLDVLLSSEEAFVSPLVGNGKVLVCVSSRR